MMDMSTDGINKLFFRQIKALSLKSVRPYAFHVFSASMPDEREASIC